jgi:DNA adenine methylase
MPPHVHYLEPFFGSGAVFFCKVPAKCETINDLDGNVVNLFRMIRERTEELATVLEMTPWARDEYLQSYEKTGDSLEDARRYLVRTWQAFGGRIGNRTGWAHCGAIGRSSTIARWKRLPNLLAQTAERLSFAEIENRPAAELIRDYESPDVLIYADPPYMWETRTDRDRGRKMYDLEMPDADHAHLLSVLDDHPGPVILSGYACPLYDDRLQHWTRLTHDATAERGKKRTEVLWMNPECVRRQGRLFD